MEIILQCFIKEAGTFLKTDDLKTKFVLITGIVSISFAASFVKLADAPPSVVAALRLIFSSILLFPAVFVSGKLRVEIKNLSMREILLLLLSGLFLSLHFFLWITSLYFTGVTNSVVLVTTSPIFITLFSVFVFGEAVSRSFWIGLAIALAGCLILGGNDIIGGMTMWKGDFLAIAGAISIAGYFIVGSRLRKKLSLLAYIIPVYITAAVFLTVALPLSGNSLLGYSFGTYVYCLMMAVVCQIIGHSSFNWVLKRLKAPMATMAIIVEPVGAAFLAYLILGDVPSFPTVLGGLIILAGISIILIFNSIKSMGLGNSSNEE
ncbi:DMT family transporter [bacterium]|nr:DMT family transporter [bacterium]